MTSPNTDRLANVVGTVTLVLGTALTVAPRRGAETLGLGDQAGFARTLGLVDLALTPGLLRGRPRWPWMAARAALNLVIAGRYLVTAGESDAPAKARAGAVGMVALTLVDGTLAVALRAADHAGDPAAGTGYRDRRGPSPD